MAGVETTPNHRRVRDVTDTDHQATPHGRRRPARTGEPPLPLDPRDPDIIRAKRLQRQPRRPAGTGLGPAGQQTTSVVHLTAGPPH